MSYIKYHLISACGCTDGFRTVVGTARCCEQAWKHPLSAWKPQPHSGSNLDRQKHGFEKKIHVSSHGRHSCTLHTLWPRHAGEPHRQRGPEWKNMSDPSRAQMLGPRAGSPRKKRRMTLPSKAVTLGPTPQHGGPACSRAACPSRRGPRTQARGGELVAVASGLPVSRKPYLDLATPSPAQAVVLGAVCGTNTSTSDT